MCAPEVPKPDPLIGQAAMSNAELAKEQAAVAREQLAWQKERAAQQDPLIQKIVNQQIAQGDINQARADEQWQIYKNLFAPVEQKMVQEAMGFDTEERKNRMAGQAAADVTQGYTNVIDQNRRAMEGLGVNPNSGRFQVLGNQTALAQARDTAGAMNKARTDTELQGIALRTGAAQFGRNMPSTGIAADTAALNAGNSAVSNINAGNAARNAGLASAQNWFGGATAANQSAGNLGLGMYQGQLQRNQLMTNQLNNTLSGIGGLAGLGLGFLALNKGGIIRGPGTGMSDSIPAEIDGGAPARLSNGEAVLNKEAVELVGEDFIHRINAGGLAMLRRDGAPMMTQGA